MKKIIYTIFSELFDIYPSTAFINKFIINDDINIDIILHHPLLKLNIAYCNLWHFIYKTYPTKKDFIDFLEQHKYLPESISEIDNKIFEKIINSFIHLKIGGIMLFDTNEINKQLIKCNEDIQKSYYITQFLYDKLMYRYNVLHNDFEISSNLIITIMNILKCHNIDISNECTECTVNPISYNINEIIEFTKNDKQYMTEYEKIQYIIYKDNHFIFKLIDNPCILIDYNNITSKDDEYIKNIVNLYQKIHDKHIILINYECTWHDELYCFHIPKTYYRLLPNLSKCHLTISNLVYPEFKSLSFKVDQAIYYVQSHIINKESIYISSTYDKYIVNTLELKNIIQTKLEKYLILSPLDNDQYLTSQDLHNTIWKLHIINICPIRSNNNKYGILIYCNFIYNYFIINNKRILSLKYRNNAKYCVILIDNRPNTLSIISVLFTMINLDENWTCKIYTSQNAVKYYEKNIGFISDIIHSDILDVNKFHIDIYNSLLKNTQLWSSIKFEKCLIIQDDGILLRKGIEKFIDYDYIGSPWLDVYENKYIKKHCNLIGNGGFSLRTVSKILFICDNYENEKNILFFQNINQIPEDVYFSKYLRLIESKLPNINEASLFGSEEILNMQSIGIHKLWMYHHPNIVLNYFKNILSELSI